VVQNYILLMDIWVQNVAEADDQIRNEDVRALGVYCLFLRMKAITNEG